MTATIRNYFGSNLWAALPHGLCPKCRYQEWQVRQYVLCTIAPLTLIVPECHPTGV